MTNPKVILLISGKRKSGKDHICENFKKQVGEICTIIRISAPLKGLYAQNHQLDLSQLLSNSPYKEKYRIKMIQWSDEIRAKNPGFFCEAACKDAKNSELWVVSDIRRKSDVKWFKETYPDRCRTVRIEADLETRKDRGWRFTEGVDDVTSECDLDDFNAWDLKIANNRNDDLTNILALITNSTKTFL